MSQALQFLILTTAGWLNRQQEDAIDYLREENRVLQEQLGCKRIRFTDAQRKRLARRGKKLGRKVLRRLAGLRRDFVFFVIELKTRHVHIAGIHHQPYGDLMEQAARNLTDAFDGLPAGRNTSDPQSGSAVHHQVCGDLEEQRRDAFQAAAEEPKSECLRRAVCSLDQE
ncbi:MAG: hypothetical protein ACI9NC_003711 [Verrucomicrobiales bacterium]|jgi:hypothetical protein